MSTVGWMSPLARRYALRLCGLTLVALLASGLLEMLFSYREAREHIGELQAVQADGAAREVATYLRGVEVGIRDVAKMPWGLPDFGPAQRREEFHRLMQMVPAIVELQALDAQGREQLWVSRSEVTRTGSGQRLGEGELLAVSAAQPLRRGSTFFNEAQVPGMRIAAFDGQGAVVGLVDLRLLNEIVERMGSAHRGQAYIVDSASRLIAHSRATEVLARRPLAESEAVQLARAALAGGQRLSGQAVSSAQGRPVIVSAAAVPGTGWLVFIEQPRGEALGPVFATLARTLVLMAVGGALAALLGVMFARRMAAPIVALKAATARIVSGQFDADIPRLDTSRRQDEVDDLAGDVNHLAARLRDLYAGLEAKVAERTAELSAARDVLEDRAEEIEILNQRLLAQLGEASLRKEEAERANAAKSRFLAAASHDLRQPMHSISLLVGVLRGRLAEPQLIDLADKVQTSVTTMENLFSNLLDISKLDAGVLHPHIEEVHLGALLQRLEHTWAPQAADKGLRLRVRPCGYLTRGDVALLERCVANLVANAVRYTRRGGVLVACRRRGECVELQVWDSGPGIAPEFQAAIFDEFFRIEAPGTSAEKGLGLGLSIAQRSARLLGYTLSLASRPGRGSVFSLRMPMSGLMRALPQLDLSPTPSGFDALGGLSGSFVVVVDDEDTNADALVAALEAVGCHVVAAPSCEQMLARLQAHLRVPDVIVTDYQLGAGRDGFEVISRLRQHYDEAIPALLVTANTEASLVEKSTLAGARLLHKPIGLAPLLEAIRAALA
jgi:signal transduction histidine kinase